MKKDVFYQLTSKGYLTTIAVTTPIFEQALIDEPIGEDGQRAGDRHNIFYYLRYGEFPEWLSFPVPFFIKDGKYFRDMIDIRCASLSVLISDRMKDILISNGLTGWITYPIRLTDKKGNEVSGYNGFSIIGRGGEWANWAEIASIPDVWERVHARCQYNMSSWDGSDFFRIYPNFVCISYRCYDVLKKNKITAIDVNPISDIADIIDDR